EPPTDFSALGIAPFLGVDTPPRQTASPSLPAGDLHDAGIDPNLLRPGRGECRSKQNAEDADMSDSPHVLVSFSMRRKRLRSDSRLSASSGPDIFPALP